MKFNIFIKLMLSPLLALVLTGSVLIFALSQMNVLAGLTVMIYEHPLQVTRAVLNANVGIVEMHRSMKDVALSTNETELNAAVAEVDKMEKEVYEQLAIVDEWILGDEGADLLAETTKLFEDWKPIRDEVISLTRAGEREQAAAITRGKGAEHVELLSTKKHELRDYAALRASEMLVEAQATRSRITSTIIIAMIVTLFAIGISGYTLTRSITTPLRELVNGVEEFGRGNRGYRVEVRTRDEIGQLAETFNIMADTRETAEEKALRESEERFRLAMEATAEGLWDWDISSNKANFSGGYFRMLGYEPESFSMDTQGWIANTHPDDREQALKANDDCIEGETAQVDTEFRMKAKDGEWRWILSRGKAASRDSSGRAMRMVGTHTDITERKLAQESLIKAEENLRMTLLSIGDGVFVTDKEGCVVRMNPVAEELSGWAFEEVQERPFNEVFHIISAKTRQRLEDPVGKVLLSGKMIGLANHTVLVAKDGTERQIADSAAPITNQDGEIIGVVLVFRDVTEEYRLREELKKHSEQLEDIVEERTRDLKDAQEQLVRREKLAILGQLAGGVGHELRNPLGVISNAIYYLQMVMTDTDEQTVEYLGMISDEIANAERIVADLLGFARIKSVAREEIDLAELVSQVLEKHPPPENVEVVKTSTPDLPQAYADRHQLEQVLTNLASNACQAMPAGGKLTIQASPEGQMVTLAMTDTGTGISEENMRKIYEPLFTTKARGIGLGLAISKNLVEANSGSIEVESEEGEGTTFRVILATKECA